MYSKYFCPMVWIGFLCVMMTGIRAEAEPLSRVEAVRLALKDNPEVIAALKEWDVARAQVWQARALPDPELELEYEELPGVFSLGKFGERNIGVVQTIEFPATWWLRNRAAVQNAHATQMQAYETAKLDLAARVKIAYDRIVFNQKIYDYSEQNLKLAQDFLAKAQARFEAGDVPQLEVLRAEVEAGRAENQVTVARSDLWTSKAELNTRLARDIKTPLGVVGDVDYQLVELDLSSLKERALVSRPDLVGAGLALASVRSWRSATVASILPNINLGIFRQTISGPTGKESFWRTGIGLELPVWAMFRQRGEIAETNAQVAKVSAQTDAVRYQVVLDVEVAFLNLKAAEQQVGLFQDRILPVAERAYEVGSQSYREGKATYLELLEAQRSLTETRIEHAEALFAYRSAMANLERAVGSDLE